MKKDFRSGIKETREGVVNDGERNTGTCDISYVNKVIDYNQENSGKFSKLKPNFVKIYKNLLCPEQVKSSGTFLTPPVLNTDKSTAHDASNSSIRSTCVSGDL